MSLPRVLLVDDSEAVLAYASASLAGLYEVTTATDGHQGLQKARALRPEAMLLDLSMPELNGVEVLQQMQADPELATIPIIVVSSERRRAEECLHRGASAFLEKPVRAEELRSTVASILEVARRRRRESGMGLLFVEVGSLRLGLPLACVRLVAFQPATSPLPIGVPYLREMIDLHGEPVCVLDMAARLSTAFALPRAERKLVVIAHGGRSVALCVDRVRDPEEATAAQLVAPSRLGGAEAGQLQDLLCAIVLTPDGPVPVLEPARLITGGELQGLAALVPPARESAGVGRR
jgi:CheY-like chemotaxis protein